MLLDEHLTPFLADFDCCYRLDGPIEPPLNTGTSCYQSPEMIEGPITKRAVLEADWWAFGCVIFFCFAKRHLFHAQTEYLSFQKILEMNETKKIQYPDDVVMPAWSIELIELALIQRDYERLIEKLGLTSCSNNDDHYHTI